MPAEITSRERSHLLRRDLGVIAHESGHPSQPILIEGRAAQFVEPEEVTVLDAVEQLAHRFGHAVQFISRRPVRRQVSCNFVRGCEELSNLLRRQLRHAVILPPVATSSGQLELT